VGDIDADRQVHQHAGEVTGGTRPARAELHLRLVRARVGDELRQIAGGQILAREQQQRRLGDKHDRCEIGRRIVERRLVERLVCRVRAHVAEHELVAVRGGFRDPAGPEHAAAAADVFDDHVLAQQLGHARRENAPDGVGRAAGGKGHHHGDRPGRPILRGSGCGRRNEGTDRGCHPDG